MNELLQPRNKVYFALVIFTVKEITHENHKKRKKLPTSAMKAENLDTRKSFQ